MNIWGVGGEMRPLPVAPRGSFIVFSFALLAGQHRSSRRRLSYLKLIVRCAPSTGFYMPSCYFCSLAVFTHSVENAHLAPPTAASCLAWSRIAVRTASTESLPSIGATSSGKIFKSALTKRTERETPMQSTCCSQLRPLGWREKKGPVN